MKLTKQIRPILGAVICGLLLATRLTAQEPDNTPTNSETVAPSDVATNGPSPTATGNGEAKETSQAPNWDNPQPVVLFGQNALLKAGDSAETVVVIGGSATIHGRVHQSVVVIGGDAEVDGDVGQAVVAVMGNVHLQPGAVVHEDAVAVGGTLSADTNTMVRGNTVAVGGRLNLADGATVKGNKVNVGFPPPFSNVQWLRNWFKYCVLEFRPLAPQVGFVWIIAGLFFLIYLFIAAAFTHPVQMCVDDLNRRPATIFLVGLLTKLLVPFIYLILVATGLGVFVVPLIGITLFLFAIIGKVAILEWIGFKAGGQFGGGLQKPLAALLLGSAIITLLYMVPVIGLLVYIILGIWGLGSGITAIFSRAHRETPETPALPSTPAATLSSAQPETPNAPPIITENAPPAPGAATSTGASAGLGTTTPPGASPFPASPQATPVAADLSSLSSFPQAAILDLILIGIISNILHLRSYLLIVALAYFTGMWMWRATTIGGIVLKLKVIKTDGRSLTFLVALVRALAAAFSVAVLFLGFLWIGWDKDKQGWHDKIAGTEVVRLPRSTPLVCL
jgi:uncharacterized RDD family membrane protein YckC